MTQLCRNTLKKYLGENIKCLIDPNIGLLLSRGLSEAGDSEQDKQAKQKHIKAVTGLKVPEVYRQAFSLWKSTTQSSRVFAGMELALSGRLYIGVQRDNALETGISTSHVYGMPMIPGSACKGLARAMARQMQMDKNSPIAYDWTFGTEGDEGEAGGLIFHDAWWVPGDKKPFVPETITVHHQKYYSGEGAEPATDFDAPVPAPQIAAQGSFYFVVEGAEAWVKIGLDLLGKGLKEIGIGSKTSSGYGFFGWKDSDR